MIYEYICGVDIGGSHITAAIFNRTYEIVKNSECRKFIGSNSPAEYIVKNWAEVINKSIKQSDKSVNKICIAMPGPFDYNRGICLINQQGKLQSLYNKNIKEMLAHKLRFSTEGIQFTNDAECFLRGEVAAGAARGYHRALGFTLGTGFGSAYFANGHVTDAELWCTAYQHSIADEYFSTRWFLERYAEKTGTKALGVKQIAAEAISGNVSAQDVFEEFGSNLAEFITNTLHYKPAEVIVLGGNIAKAYDLFKATLVSKLQTLENDVSIKCSELGETAALIGSIANV